MGEDDPQRTNLGRAAGSSAATLPLPGSVQLARLRTMRSDAAKKVEAANAELDDEWLFTAQRTLELAKSAAELWVSRSGAEKRMLLEMMVSNPTLTGRKVAYELKKPFAVLAEIRRKGVGRAP